MKSIYKKIIKKGINMFKRKKTKAKSKIEKGYFTRIKNSKFEGNNYIGALSHIYNSKIGKMTYFNSNCSILHTKIGRYCSVAGDVKVIVGAHPTNTWVSIHPAFYSKRNCCKVSYTDQNLFEEYKYVDKEKKYMVEIGNDVWIGTKAMISGGVKIGDGAIVLAGAVVTKDVEPYSIVGGVPAKTIGKRFEDEDIEFLLNLKWWEKDDKWILKNAHLFNDVNLLKKELEKNN